MVQDTDADQMIQIDQLQVGVYIYLDLGWINHPFSFNNFKIRTPEQLKAVKALGLEKIRWDPARSDAKPLPLGTTPTPTPESSTPEPQADATELHMMAAKRRRIQRLTEHREAIAEVEKAFTSASNVVRGINKNIYSQPEKTLAETGQLIQQIASALLQAPDLAIQVMAEKSGEDVYFHALNVSVLSMIVGRELALPPELVQALGLGGILHDIGLNDIPPRIAHGPDPLNKVEQDFRQQHCQYGYDLGKRIGISAPVLNIIFQHHEAFDGSGYPQGLKGTAIDSLARIISAVNIYDNLCNPPNIANALTPHEALSHLFAKMRNRFDPKVLQTFIRMMGVYPPGTVVQLSNEVIGLVIRINPAKPLRPTVIVYDPKIPKNEALMLDLEEEPDINISKAIRPSLLPSAVYDYLSPRRRVSYYFSTQSSSMTQGR